MSFHYISGETIVAQATPPGEGGIAIVRISGKKAFEVAAPLFSKDLSLAPTHKVMHGFAKNLAGETLDEVLVLPFRAPCSFTGENTVEFHCHGGRIAAGRVIQAAIEAGARVAYPGEFSFQAFMNGKIDLTQAEAIQQLISSKSERAFRVAQSHLEGRLSAKVIQFQNECLEIAAILEAWVDFPEEGLEFSSMENLTSRLKCVLDEMEELVATFEDGKQLQEGLSVALIGPPNAGKSSLLNALSKRERAIVTPIAGTTRDLVEETVLIDGLQMTLVDTAGIRQTDEQVEMEGIKRALAQLEKVDCIVLVMDATRPQLLVEFLHFDPQKTLLVWNKIDQVNPEVQNSVKHMFSSLAISATEGLGLDKLRRELSQRGAKCSESDVVLTQKRHKESLSKAIKALESALQGLEEGESPEFLTFEMKTALKALGELIGLDVGEEILSSIFSNFCVGK